MRGMSARRQDDARAVRREALTLAEAALRHWGIEDARLSPLSLGYKHVFRVSRPGGEEFVLRTYGVPGTDEETLRRRPELRTGAGLRSSGTLRSQLAWLSDLGNEGLRVPEPVPALDGSVVVPVGTGSRWRRVLPFVTGRPARRCVLLRWVPGGHRTRELSRREASLAGSLLARLHRHGERFDLSGAPALPRWDWNWAFGLSAPIQDEGARFYSAGEMRAFEHAADRVRSALEEIGDGPEAFGPTHWDFRLENLVFDGEKVGVIDFDVSGLCHYLFDFSRTRSSLRSHFGGRSGPLWEAFLAGYEAERPLPEDLDRHLWAFAAMRRMATINTRLASGPACPGERARSLKSAADWFQSLDPGQAGGRSRRRPRPSG